MKSPAISLWVASWAFAAWGQPTLQVDFPALRIGVTEYEEGPTGATVFYFPDGVMAAVDVRGGAPGTILTDSLRRSYPAR